MVLDKKKRQKLLGRFVIQDKPGNPSGKIVQKQDKTRPENLIGAQPVASTRQQNYVFDTTVAHGSRRLFLRLIGMSTERGRHGRNLGSTNPSAASAGGMPVSTMANRTEIPKAEPPVRPGKKVKIGSNGRNQVRYTQLMTKWK